MYFNPTVSPWTLLPPEQSPYEPVRGPAWAGQALWGPGAFPGPDALAPLPASPGRGSGQKLSNQGRAQQQYDATRVEAIWPEQEEILRIASAMEQIPAIREQRAGQDQLRELFSMEAQAPMPLDLSPLVGLTDTWTGSRLGQYYRPPESPSDRRKTLLSYGEKIQDNQRDLAKAVIDAAGKYKSGTETQKLQQLLALTSGREAMDPTLRPAGAGGRPDTKAGGFLRLYRQNKEIANAGVSVTAARDLISQGESANWLTDQTARARLIQQANLHPVSDRDMALVGGSPAVLDALKRTWKRIVDGDRFTEKDRADLKAFAEFQIKKTEAIVGEVTRQFAESVGPQFGYDSATALSLLSSEVPTANRAGVLNASKTAAPKPGPSFKQFLEERRKATPAPSPSPSPSPLAPLMRQGFKQMLQELRNKRGS